MNKALAILTIAVLAGAASADWQGDPPAKWVQFPDLSPTGLDVRSGPNPAFDPLIKTLADDFLCTETGPITSIHIWGSWLHDQLPMGDPGAVHFRLSLHGDIPANQSPTGYSMPEPEPFWLGEFGPGAFTWRVEEDGLQEQFYDPNFNEIIGLDTVCYQYNFDTTQAGVESPRQHGTPDQPIVYWLDVTALPGPSPDGEPVVFGWKTSLDHWNDDAVFWDEGSGLPPRELRYPIGHPFAGESIDLAFAIVPEPATMVLLTIGGLAVLRRRRGV